MADLAEAVQEDEDEFASLNAIVVTLSLLLLIAIGYRINTHRLRHVPESGAAMALGFALGLAVRVLHMQEQEQLLNFSGSFFFYVLLPPIIFEAGLALETKLFVDNFGAICAYAVVGTLVSTWVTSNGLRLAAELGGIGLDASSPRLVIHCHLFGSLISATDPVATIALFGSARFRADPLMHSLINGESVLNDAVAIALFSTLSHHLDEEAPTLLSLPVLGHFAVISSFSLVLGLLAGALCSWSFCRSSQLSMFPEYEILAMCLCAYLTFSLSQLLGLSGIVSLFFFGVVLKQYNYYNLSERSKIASQVTFGTLAKIAESVVFVYLGAVAALSIGRLHWHLGLIVYTCLVISVARAAHIFPITSLLNRWRQRKKISQNMTMVMWISGLRGAIAFALSLRLPCEAGSAVRRGTPECRNSDLLVTTTMSIVMLTTWIIGSAMEHVMTVMEVIEVVPAGTDSPGLHSPTTCSDGLSRADGAALSAPCLYEAYADSESSTACSGRDLRREGILREGSSSKTLFNARGWAYQVFARFDLNHLQPMLGGPCRGRVEINGDSELPSIPSRAPAYDAAHVPDDDAPPEWSRAVIFE